MQWQVWFSRQVIMSIVEQITVYIQEITLVTVHRAEK